MVIRATAVAVIRAAVAVGVVREAVREVGRVVVGAAVVAGRSILRAATGGRAAVAGMAVVAGRVGAVVVVSPLGALHLLSRPAALHLAPSAFVRPAAILLTAIARVGLIVASRTSYALPSFRAPRLCGRAYGHVAVPYSCSGW